MCLSWGKTESSFLEGFRLFGEKNVISLEVGLFCQKLNGFPRVSSVLTNHPPGCCERYRQPTCQKRLPLTCHRVTPNSLAPAKQTQQLRLRRAVAYLVPRILVPPPQIKWEATSSQDQFGKFKVEAHAVLLSTGAAASEGWRSPRYIRQGYGQ